MTSKLLTLGEVSEMTRIPAATLRWFRHAGKGPRSGRLGSRVFYQEQDVLAWIDEQFADDAARRQGAA